MIECELSIFKDDNKVLEVMSLFLLKGLTLDFV